MERPDIVLVHGDTTTTLAASLAAYYSQTKVGHVEAGLRTGNKFSPFPEEINRRVAGAISDLHFAPTEAARFNLLREGESSDDIYVTGNTVVDALLSVADRLKSGPVIRREMEERFSLPVLRKLFPVQSGVLEQQIILLWVYNQKTEILHQDR